MDEDDVDLSVVSTIWPVQDLEPNWILLGDLTSTCSLVSITEDTRRGQLSVDGIHFGQSKCGGVALSPVSSGWGFGWGFG